MFGVVLQSFHVETSILHQVLKNGSLENSGKKKKEEGVKVRSLTLIQYPYNTMDFIKLVQKQISKHDQLVKEDIQAGLDINPYHDRVIIMPIFQAILQCLHHINNHDLADGGKMVCTTDSDKGITSVYFCSYLILHMDGRLIRCMPGPPNKGVTALITSLRLAFGIQAALLADI
jgi:hypothetical protein